MDFLTFLLESVAFPTRSARIEVPGVRNQLEWVLGESVGLSLLGLSLQDLYKLFRRYGKISGIVQFTANC